MTNSAASPTMPQLQAVPELPGPAAPPTLSQALRSDTATAHQQVELRLALPNSIHSLADYRACLLRFYQLYRPIELQFQRFPYWHSLGLNPSALSANLALDLQALTISVPEIPLAPATALPPLPDFPSALGASYVMEGSALGSQFMLPHLQKTLGDQISGADTFFRGRGPDTKIFWKQFRAALNHYGLSHPRQIPAVISSAIATFGAVGLWMQPTETPILP